MIWSRPVTSPPLLWCAVARIVRSVETLCGGRWDALDPMEERDTEPPRTERCGKCWELTVVSQPSLPVLPARVYRDIKPDNLPPLIPCPCGCRLLTTGTRRCDGCDREISLAHWDGLYDSCGDCADRMGELADDPFEMKAGWTGLPYNAAPSVSIADVLRTLDEIRALPPVVRELRINPSDEDRILGALPRTTGEPSLSTIPIVADPTVQRGRIRKVMSNEPHPLDCFVPILAEPEDPVDNPETPTPEPDDFEMEIDPLADLEDRPVSALAELVTADFAVPEVGVGE